MKGEALLRELERQRMLKDRPRDVKRELVQEALSQAAQARGTEAFKLLAADPAAGAELKAAQDRLYSNTPVIDVPLGTPLERPANLKPPRGTGKRTKQLRDAYAVELHPAGIESPEVQQRIDRVLRLMAQK